MPEIGLYADGINLDDLSVSIGMKSNRWAAPGIKGENVLVPARHGSLYVADKTFTEGEFSLEILVSGTAPNYGPPVYPELEQLQQNIDRMMRIFTKRKKLINFSFIQDNGNEIECWAECTGTFDITRDSALIPFARFVATFKIPGAFWKDVELTYWNSGIGLETSQALRFTGFEGASAPMDDLEFLVHGPWSDPELRVIETGAFTRLERELEFGDTWRIRCADWTSVMGPDVTWDSSGDPSVIASTFHGGSSALMDIPPLNPFELAIEVAGENIGPGAYVEARGYRKHLIG